jgi:hypothetical protein
MLEAETIATLDVRLAPGPLLPRRRGVDGEPDDTGFLMALRRVFE